MAQSSKPQTVVVIDPSTGMAANVTSSGLDVNVTNAVTISDPIDVNIVGGKDTDTTTAVFDITALSTTLVSPAATDFVRLYIMYVATSDTMIPCTWSFKFGSGSDLFETYFASKGARLPLYFTSRGLDGDDNEDLTFTVDLTNSNLRVTIVYEEV